MLQHPGENAFGHDLESGRATHSGIETHAVSDGASHGLTQGLRHTLGYGPRSQPSGLQHDEFSTFDPRLIQQGEWYYRAFSGAGRRLDHGRATADQSGSERRKRFDDRQ
jgi:hypothetical protein